MRKEVSRKNASRQHILTVRYRVLLSLFLYGVWGLCAPGLFAGSFDLGQIVVTPLKVPVSGWSQSVHTDFVGADAFEEQFEYTVGEALGGMTGIDVIGGGRIGTASGGINIRGGQTRHTTYMFEGMKLYDPSNTSAYYVPSDFLTSGLEKIEVVKFPLSSLYGSSPVAGAVNFITKRPQGAPYISLTTMGGSHATSQETLELGGKVNGLSYLFNVARIDSDGISKAKEKNNNPEKDAYQNTNVTANLIYSEEDEFEVGMVFKGIMARAELDDDDNLDGIPEDDLDNISWNKEMAGVLYGEKKFNEYFSYRAQGGISSVYRRYRDDNAGGADEYTRGWYKGWTYQFSNHLKIDPVDGMTSIIGYDYTREKMDSYRYTFDYTWMFGFESDSPKEITDTKGWFFEQIFEPTEDITLDFSYRREDHAIFDEDSICKVSGSYRVGDAITLFASFGEGFKAPSLYQLYSANGNTALQPEESQTWEVGFDYEVNDKISLGAAYFHSNFRNLIDFVYTNPAFFVGQYLNAAKAESEGVEIKVDADINDRCSFAAGYTYLNGDQDFVDQDFVTIFKHSLIRMPVHKAFARLSYSVGKLTTSFDMRYVGKRIDRIWVGMFDEFVTMKAYLLGNLSFDYAVDEHTSLFLKVHNIFNKDYERIKGYQEEKLSLYAGARLRF